jgi:hypothetical protein
MEQAWLKIFLSISGRVILRALLEEEKARRVASTAQKTKIRKGIEGDVIRVALSLLPFSVLHAPNLP